MTDAEVQTLIVEWMRAKGGTVTEEQFDDLTAVLEEHFPDPETATLQEAREVLGLS